MRLLLDTHAFIWWDSEPARLSARVAALLSDPANTILLSVASAWEMQIKLQLGKLKLSLPLAAIITGQQGANGLELLPITLPHVLALEGLPGYHKDPFDRLLIAQAGVEGAALISSDPVFARYTAQVLW